MSQSKLQAALLATPILQYDLFVAAAVHEAGDCGVQLGGGGDEYICFDA